RIQHLHTTHTPSFLGLSAESGLCINSGYGDGVIIGVLDTEIWPQHPSFLDHGFSDDVPSKWCGACEISKDFPVEACNRKLIGARTFYKGYESYRGRSIDESLESKSPKDTEGHGTHTASTDGGSIVRNASLFHYADGEARGVATKAWIAAYKICWLSGCFNFDILAAMDQAIEDGVDVISLSVGSSYASPSYADSIAIGAFAAARRGIVVSCLAGNSGPGVHTASNIAPWILTVGASVNHRL
ncbi:Subtilisin-like protease SBT1.4, partial [Linum perenne]